MTENVILENDHVRITYLYLPRGGVHADPLDRDGRAVVYLDESYLLRTTAEESCTMVRDVGQIDWYEASPGESLSNMDNTRVRIMIIEVKSAK